MHIHVMYIHVMYSMIYMRLQANRDIERERQLQKQEGRQRERERDGVKKQEGRTEVVLMHGIWVLHKRCYMLLIYRRHSIVTAIFKRR